VKNSPSVQMPRLDLVTFAARLLAPVHHSPRPVQRGLRNVQSKQSEWPFS
jgi:hypothetical protein